MRQLFSVVVVVVFQLLSLCHQSEVLIARCGLPGESTLNRVGVGVRAAAALAACWSNSFCLAESTAITEE